MYFRDHISLHAVFPEIVAFLDYWCSKWDPTRPTDYPALDPLEIPRLLRYVWLCETEVTPSGKRFRFRLIGTTIRDRVGTEARGRYVDSFVSRTRWEAVRRFYEAPDVGRIALQTGRMGPDHMDHVWFQRLFVPLIRGDRRLIGGLTRYAESNETFQSLNENDQRTGFIYNPLTDDVTRHDF